MNHLEENTIRIDYQRPHPTDHYRPPAVSPYHSGGPVWAGRPQLHLSTDTVPTHNRRHRRRPVWVLPALVIGIVSVIAGAVLVLAGLSQNYIHVGSGGVSVDDSGVRACRLIAAQHDASAAPSPAPSPDTAANAALLRTWRRMFEQSRFDDLRAAGTGFVDLVAQFDPGNDGSALLLGGALIQSYASLSGACGAHGVPLPKLTGQ